MLDLDFLPDDYHQQRQSRELPAVHFVIAACVATVIAIAMTSNAVEQHQFGGQLEGVNAAYDQANTNVRELTNVSQQLNRLRRDAFLGVSLSSLPSRSRVLADIAEKTPRGVRLTSLMLAPAAESPRPAANVKQDSDTELKRLVAASLRSSQVVLEGQAETTALVHKFVGRIRGGTSLTGVELDTLRADQDGFAFRVVALLAPPRPDAEDES